MYTKVNIYEAKTHFSKIINEVAKTGNPIIISKNGKPIVKIVSYQDEKMDPLAQDSTLLGAVYHCDPCMQVSEEDWPVELR